MAGKEITWEAPEFEYREKGVAWYWSTIIVAVLLLAVSVWQRNFLFGVFVTAAELLILFWGGEKPQSITFTLDEQKLSAGTLKVYPFSEIEAFHVQEEEGPYRTLLVRFKKNLRPTLSFLLPKERAAEIHARLAQVLPQKEMEQSFSEHMQKFFGF